MKLTAERLYKKLGKLTVKESREFTIVCMDTDGNFKDATYRYNLATKQIEIIVDIRIKSEFGRFGHEAYNVRPV